MNLDAEYLSLVGPSAACTVCLLWGRLCEAQASGVLGEAECQWACAANLSASFAWPLTGAEVLQRGEGSGCHCAGSSPVLTAEWNCPGPSAP